MKIYIFTFGVSGELGDKYQPIIAFDYKDARALMVEFHGLDWALSYTNEQFEQSKQKGYFLNLEPLETIDSKEAV